MKGAELACEYVAARVRAAAGHRWLQGKRAPALDTTSEAHVVRLFAEHRLYRIPEHVVRGLVAWADGRRQVEVSATQPAPAAILALQARGVRCVSILPDGVPTAPHADGLAFVLHDICHLEKFVAPEHHLGQVGFFALLDQAIAGADWRALEAPFDDAWQSDRDHVMADMNGSAIFLFAALKMKLKMAVRRRLARERGREAPISGPLDATEERSFDEALEALTAALGLDGETRDAAARVSTRHDHPSAARHLLRHFEGQGRAVLGR